MLRALVPRRIGVDRILKLVVYFLTAMYFLVDAIFLTVAKSLANWVAAHWISERLRLWIVALRPYPTLALFALPVVVLEPVKPMAAYLIGTGHVATGIVSLIIAEILKLALVERLFSVSRDKLMTIPAFAWAFWKYRLAKDWITSVEAWQAMQRWSFIAQYVVRSYALRASKNPSRIITFQSR
jgi:hypothetical protein